jgi:hypothetical protein
MDIAKPRSGFNIVEPPAVAALINSQARKWPRLKTYWADVKSRLAQTGHREGQRIKGPPGARLFIAAGDQSSGLPTIKVAYTVLGDTLDICMVTVV